jgi:hypothetical protein
VKAALLPDPDDQLPPFKADEAARRIGCSEWWLKEQARRRRVPYTWISGSYRFTAVQIAEIIAAQEVRPVDPPPANRSRPTRCPGAAS